MPRIEPDEHFLRTATVLYVEDDDATRQQLAMYLQRRVGKLITAANGAEGLALFIAQQPRIVVTDILMPKMDGLEMSRKIRELDQHVPIIVTTAFEQKDYLIRSIEIGVDKYVVKPVDCERFQTALLTCARRLRAEEQLEEQRRLETEALRIRHLEALTMLVAGMAHDFNNLLQAILGFVYIAKEEAEPGSKVRELLTMADGCSIQARELGERLLSIARRQQALRQCDSLEMLVHDVVKGVLNGSNITCEFHFPDNSPRTTFAKEQMGEVITQFTHNALEAMPDGGTFRVSAQTCRVAHKDGIPLPSGEYLQVTFADTGCGIAPEHLPKIFDPYFSTRDIGSQKGMGLGLALCDTIVRNHGGMIRVDSQIEAGARFHIWLPVSGEDGAGMDLGANI